MLGVEGLRTESSAFRSHCVAKPRLVLLQRSIVDPTVLYDILVFFRLLVYLFGACPVELGLWTLLTDVAATFFCSGKDAYCVKYFVFDVAWILERLYMDAVH